MEDEGTLKDNFSWSYLLISRIKKLWNQLKKREPITQSSLFSLQLVGWFRFVSKLMLTQNLFI